MFSDELVCSCFSCKPIRKVRIGTAAQKCCQYYILFESLKSYSEFLKMFVYYIYSLGGHWQTKLLQVTTRLSVNILTTS